MTRMKHRKSRFYLTWGLIRWPKTSSIYLGLSVFQMALSKAQKVSFSDISDFLRNQILSWPTVQNPHIRSDWVQVQTSTLHQHWLEYFIIRSRKLSRKGRVWMLFITTKWVQAFIHMVWMNEADCRSLHSKLHFVKTVQVMFQKCRNSAILCCWSAPFYFFFFLDEPTCSQAVPGNCSQAVPLFLWKKRFNLRPLCVGGP